mmetsp:Transcript_6663/g.23822  ORF Transcript_6663/g.23822 Transcript_6663/m.23822 type:complete len:429 (-) Transcript_6663:67-1353(-)
MGSRDDDPRFRRPRRAPGRRAAGRLPEIDSLASAAGSGGASSALGSSGSSSCFCSHKAKLTSEERCFRSASGCCSTRDGPSATSGPRNAAAKASRSRGPGSAPSAGRPRGAPSASPRVAPFVGPRGAPGVTPRSAPSALRRHAAVSCRRRSARITRIQVSSAVMTARSCCFGFGAMPFGRLGFGAALTWKARWRCAAANGAQYDGAGLCAATPRSTSTRAYDETKRRRARVLPLEGWSSAPEASGLVAPRTAACDARARRPKSDVTRAIVAPSWPAHHSTASTRASSALPTGPAKASAHVPWTRQASRRSAWSNTTATGCACARAKSETARARSAAESAQLDLPRTLSASMRMTLGRRPAVPTSVEISSACAARRGATRGPGGGPAGENAVDAPRRSARSQRLCIPPRSAGGRGRGPSDEEQAPPPQP